MTDQSSRSVSVADKRIGENIRRLRRLADRSQKEVAAALGITFQQLQKYETGQNRLPSAYLYELSHILGVSYEHFFTSLPHKDKAPAKDGKPAEDPVAQEIVFKLTRIKDTVLKVKISQIVDILAA